MGGWVVVRGGGEEKVARGRRGGRSLEFPDCLSPLKQPIRLKSAPNVLALEINSKCIKISKTLKFWQKINFRCYGM